VKKILAIILKDTKIRFTSPVEWLFFLIMPLIFIFILSGGTGAPADSRLTLLTVDQAASPLSASLIAELEKSSSIKPKAATLQDALDEFDARQVSAVLIIPSGFTAEALADGRAEVELKQQKNNLNALVHQQAVQTAVGRLGSLVDIANASVSQAEAIASFANPPERQAYFDEALRSAQILMADTPQRVTKVEAGTQDEVAYDPRANSTAGQMITWVFIPLIGLCAIFAMERAGGTLERLLVTPTSKALYIGSTVLGQVLTALLQMTLLMIFGMLVMRINWGHSPVALALVMITSALAAASLGTMLGTFVKTEGQANGLAIMIGMVMAMMGGCWYPIELFPQAVRSAAQVLPTFWAMQGFLDIAVRGQGLGGVLQESAMLLGFAVIFFAIGVWRFKFE
jgi:ABC-2 type transport system permease protein